MGIDRSNISRWVSGERDPLAEVVPEIRIALGKLDPAAAETFVKLYLYNSAEEDLGEEMQTLSWRKRG